jgi:hypothetical protein
VHWYQTLLQHLGFERHGTSGWTRTTPEHVEAIKKASHWSPNKSILRASREILPPRLIIYDVVSKSHSLWTAVDILITGKWFALRYDFAFDILTRIGDESGYINMKCFSDEVLSLSVVKLNAIITAYDDLKVFILHGGLNMIPLNWKTVWWGLKSAGVIGPLFFLEKQWQVLYTLIC